jgi:transposase
VLKPLIVPWIKSLKRRGKSDVLLLEDGAPAHGSKFDAEFLAVSYVAKLPWPGHSPDVNAEEHAWPWIRRHITKDFEPSCTVEECKTHWYMEWRALPQGQIDRWIDGIPDVVRKIIEQWGDNSFHDG